MVGQMGKLTGLLALERSRAIGCEILHLIGQLESSQLASGPGLKLK